jgi:molecular chaperone DnaJ
MRTYYQILGVREDARADEIKHAFRRLVRQFHPDVAGGDPGSLRQVMQAYETLSDTERRRSYDHDLASRRRPTPAAQLFADEVAIDFPSISEVVDRIRRAFLGFDDMEDDALSAEILLSRREASDGVTVPLDVPVRSTCPLCGGRGESWMETCRGCLGTGDWHLPHRVRLSVPAGVADGTRFRFTISAPDRTPTHIEVRVAVR